MKKGTFCFSLDTELMWGRHDLVNYQSFIKRAGRERIVVTKLLELFKKYEIPATWAVVGHLFLDSCSNRNQIKHPEIVRGSFPWVREDWFAKDPATSLEKDPLWYGKDIVKSIQSVKNQEIASHSFSHVQFGHQACSRECAESEIKECVDLAKKQGIKLLSFIFPHNSVGHLDVLKKYGFICFRGKDRYTLLKSYSRILAAFELFIPTASTVGKPSIEHGLINIPGSMYFVSARGIRSFIPKGVRFRKAKRGIEKAIKSKSVFHLWTHPIDLVDNTQDLFSDLEEILMYVSKKRGEGKLEIKNMRQIAKEYLS